MVETETNQLPPDHGGRENRRLLENYLTEVKAIRATGGGVAETSYYPALSNLFNAAGASLKPKVRCVMNLRNLGDGLPDGGLFTADQFQRQTEGVPKAGQLPAHGAIEAKGTKPDVRTIAASQQVKDYLNTYGIVVVTNLREFLIVERGPDGRPVEREAFAIAEDETDFWQRKAASPAGAAHRIGGPFAEFIQRACLHAAPLTSPKDAAWFLASYARDALVRVERQKELPALQKVRAALEEALGMKFTGDKGEHFFRSTLVQTLFYGVFSAWVRWHKDGPAAGAKFDWRTAEWSLHVPFIKTLYHQVASPDQLGGLGLVETLDWAAGVLNRIRREEFFARFEEEHAVQYFYEPFLEAYDPELRKALGVWYTPPEIVHYQVARVDHVLREELKLDDGLADPNVVVLDPCCGTGAYLVEVLHRIAATLRDKGGDALVAADLKKAAMERVFGFEIMPAPFVVAHLQLGLLLQSQGAPLSHKKNERVGVYLTNALTGWRVAGQPKPVPLFPELQDERDAAEEVKRGKTILVVLGNPPYNAFAGVSPDEEEGLVAPYKAGLNKPANEGGWGIKKFNLDDLYVRFFRLAERRIAEMSGKGVVSFISNFSYLADPSFVVMRQRFLAEFDKLWLDCLNGDSRETGKLTPEGKPDPSVFSTDYNREGIRVGTAISVIVRKPTRQKTPTVRFRHFWGMSKREELLQSLNAKNIDKAYTLADPQPENRYSFRPENVAGHYAEWPKVTDLSGIAPVTGFKENRGFTLIDSDREALSQRMTAYCDSSISWEDLKASSHGLTRDAARFPAAKARTKMLEKESFSLDQLRRYVLRPFELKHCYYTPVRPIWNEPRPSLFVHLFPGNGCLVTRPDGVADPEGPPFYFVKAMADFDFIRGHSYHFPTRLQPIGPDIGALFSASKPQANLSDRARAYLAQLGIANPDADAATAGLLWMHVLAVGYSPTYLSENADGVRRDWPRVPLPASRAALEASAALGERVAALLDTEAEASGVTSGKVGPLFKTIGLISKIGGGQLDATAGDLAVTAGWGHKGKEGVTMPGKGRLVERAYDAAEVKALEAEAAERGLSAAEARRLLGEKTCDVYLNGAAYWCNIPLGVWDFYIGGYQVVKKWLSYREVDFLGRALKPEEAREVMNIARRLAALRLLQPKLDANYQAIKEAAFAWPTLNQL